MTNRKLTPAQRKALQFLADANEPANWGYHFSASTRRALVRFGLATEDHWMAQLTEAGRVALPKLDS